MSAAVTILNADGQPMAPSKVKALAGSNAPFDAADIWGDRMSSWTPFLWSPDGELNMYRDRIVSRARDLAKNDGWASGTLTSMLDNAIGANFRPVAKPDWRMLAWKSGNPRYDAVWAREYGQAADAGWRHWADSDGKWCDVTRNQVVSQMQYLAFRHFLLDGDALAIMQWLPDRVSPGHADYATAVQLIDPDRLSNPQMRWDQKHSRGGVVVDDWGATTGYYIRRAHFGDWFNAAEAMTWDLIPRETPWGRPIVVHFFELERAGQHRGGAGILTPVMQRLKMLIKYDGTELDAAIINAIFAGYIESPFDHEMINSMLDSGADGLGVYQDKRREFHDGRKVALGEVVMPKLFPGEKIGFVNAARPTSNFDGFEAAVLRNVAAGTGHSYEQISRDYSKGNYSSIRASFLDVWKTLHRRRSNFAIGFSKPVHRCFMEEAFEETGLPLPQGGEVLPFVEASSLYCRSRWVGPGRGWVDPVKEKQAAVLGIEAGLSTLESESAEQGRDWEEDLAQRKIEIEAYEEAGVPLPNWAKVSADYAQKPETETGGNPP